MKIKVGDIVKAKFGSVVFTNNGKTFCISVYGVVTKIETEEQGNKIFIKIVFDNAPEVEYKEEDLEIISSTNLVQQNSKV